MLIWAITLAIGFTSYEDWRTGPAFVSATSQKSAGEISGCLNDAWQGRSGQTSYVPTADGFRMRLTYSVFGQPMVAAEVDVFDRGTARLIEVRARKGDRSKKLRREVEGCA